MLVLGGVGKSCLTGKAGLPLTFQLDVQADKPSAIRAECVD